MAGVRVRREYKKTLEETQFIHLVYNGDIVVKLAFIFLGDFTPSGRQNCIMILRFTGKQSMVPLFHSHYIVQSAR